MLDNRSAFESIKALESILLRNTQSTRRTVISERLSELLDNINELRVGRALQPARIAREIGEDYAKPLENWFTGKQEPSFKQLEAFAQYLGSTIEWLQFGDSPKFTVKTSRVPESAAEGASWLLDLNQPEKPTSIYFVRSQSETGELIIIKKNGDWRCEIHLTPYHVSEKIGNGGESSLAYLLVICRLLYEVYLKSSAVIVKSYLLSDYQFSVRVWCIH